MRNWLELYGPVTGRVMIALLFITAGLDNTADFQDRVIEMGYMGLPLPEAVRAVLLAVAIAIEIIGGVLLILGLYARYAAAAIFVLTLVVSALYHPAWLQPGQMMDLLKNLAIMGGLLYVVAHGPGRYTVGHSD